MRTSIERLIEISVLGEVAHPGIGHSPYNVTADGDLAVLVGTGGITYNMRVGDSAVDWEADHVEPAVSIKNKEATASAAPTAA
ncbi:MAG: DUF4438 domain-containing protein [Bacillota bacterium]